MLLSCKKVNLGKTNVTWKKGNFLYMIVQESNNGNIRVQAKRLSIGDYEMKIDANAVGKVEGYVGKKKILYFAYILLPTRFAFFLLPV